MFVIVPEKEAEVTPAATVTVLGNDRFGLLDTIATDVPDDGAG